MASAQVAPNSAVSSRKQGHLEAGKKRLEEFRKKKAEGRAKKAVSAGQLESIDANQHEKLSQNCEQVRDGAESAREDTSVSIPYRLAMDNEGKAVNSSQSIDIDSSNGMHAISHALTMNHHALHGDSENDAGDDEVSKFYGNSVFSKQANGYFNHWGDNNELNHNNGSNFVPGAGILGDGFSASDSVRTNPDIGGSSSHSNDHSEEIRNPSMISMSNHGGAYIMNASERLGDVSAQNKLVFPSTSASISGVNEERDAGVIQQHFPSIMDHGSAFGGRKVLENSNHINADSRPWHVSGASSKDLSLSNKSLPNQQPFPSNDSGATFGRSRPSFLDSLGLHRGPSTSQSPYYSPQEANPPTSFTTNSYSNEVHLSSSMKQISSEPNSSEQTYKLRTPAFVSEELSTTSASSNDSHLPKLGVTEHLHRDLELPIADQKEGEFAALEQHIEDLTQEKFSLQRALDTSRNLSESLASENSSLTERYNLQGQTVNQLKSDIERMQEEINAQLVTIESVKMEYTNAQLECNAADERAKILASEVIALEEKALRLRSNELKLEKQLEKVNSEIISYKRKVAILEKERQDFQLTIDAMQEEKKLLQFKLRKASTNGIVSDTSMKTSSIKRDVSTSTEDLGGEHLNLVDGQSNIAESVVENSLQDISPPTHISSGSSNVSLLREDERHHLVDASGVIPSDHLRIIDNINSLVSELALEKEELMRALKFELSNNSNLKELNKDISQKLVAQTQRLELLTAQRMANENNLAKPIDTHNIRDTEDYADEGDEVVERVLGWIMKLFPGGPAKRRPSKLL